MTLDKGNGSTVCRESGHSWVRAGLDTVKGQNVHTRRCVWCERRTATVCPYADCRC